MNKDLSQQLVILQELLKINKILFKLPNLIAEEEEDYFQVMVWHMIVIPFLLKKSIIPINIWKENSKFQIY